MAATAPGMAAAEPPAGQHAAVEHAMDLQCLDGVLGATGRETAMARRAEHRGQYGRERPLIDAQGENQDLAGQIHSVFNNPLLRSMAMKVSSTAPKPLPTMLRCATSTKSTG